MGALRVSNNPFVNFNPGRTFSEQVIKGAIHYGASELEHFIAIGLEPPCSTAFEPVSMSIPLGLILRNASVIMEVRHECSRRNHPGHRGVQDYGA